MDDWEFGSEIVKLFVVERVRGCDLLKILQEDLHYLVAAGVPTSTCIDRVSSGMFGSAAGRLSRTNPLRRIMGSRVRLELTSFLLSQRHCSVGKLIQAASELYTYLNP